MESRIALHRIVTPQSLALRQHIISFNILDAFTLCEQKKYVAFPQRGVPVAFFKEAKIEVIDDVLTISKDASQPSQVVLLGKYLNPIEVHYKDFVPKISIHFTELGANYFIKDYFLKYAPQDIQIMPLESFEIDCGILFDADENKGLNYLEACLEGRLLEVNLDVLEKAVACITHDPFISNADLSQTVALSEKTLRRRFLKYLGCSIADYKRLVRFRKVIDSFFTVDHKRLLDLTYDHGYYDSSHFYRHILSLTGLGPKKFFKEVKKLGFENHTYIIK